MLAHRVVVDGDRVSDSIERALLIVLYALPKVNRLDRNANILFKSFDKEWKPHCKHQSPQAAQGDW